MKKVERRGTFGYMTVQDPRILQLAMKFVLGLRRGIPSGKLVQFPDDLPAIAR